MSTGAGEPAATTDTGTAATSSSSSTGAADEGSTTAAEMLHVEVTAVTYPQQPMVVDLAFWAPDLQVAVTHATDPGVRVGPLVGTPEQTRVRVRGLAPGTLHSLQWSVQDGQGATADGTLEVLSEAPLPGFTPVFPVQGGADAYADYVLFDHMSVTALPTASVAVVDGDGITRWQLGRFSAGIDPAAVFAAAKLRADGSVMFLQDYALIVVDELGAEQLVLTADQLGVAGLHHDAVELANGNFLTMSFTFRDIDYPDVGTLHVVGDLLLEVTPAGAIVWQWDAFDHLDPLRTLPGFEAELVDPQTGEPAHDWTHSNGLLYEPDTDSVLLSIRHQDWLVRIDRATGDIVWRFGYEGDFTLASGTWPHHQHSPQWQQDGTLLLYDNGLSDPDVDDDLETSRAVRYAIDTRAMTVTQVWEDQAEDFLVPIAGDADRLADGSILVTDSSIDFFGPNPHARIRKIDEDTSATPTWSLATPAPSFVYRCIATTTLPGETR